jgi:flagellar protein FliL
MATAADVTTPRKGGMVGWLVLIFAALLAIAAGFSVPLYLIPAPQKKAAPAVPEPKRPALLPFGEVVVNLGEERLTRYLRAKLLIVVDESQQKSVKELVEKQKPFMKSWLISYLSDQSLQEVSGAAGVNRIRREVRDRFNTMLFPDNSDGIQDILFDEFVVQ